MIPDHVSLPVEAIKQLLEKDKLENKWNNQWCRYGIHRVDQGHCIRCHVLEEVLRAHST